MIFNRDLLGESAQRTAEWTFALSRVLGVAERLVVASNQNKKFCGGAQWQQVMEPFVEELGTALVVYVALIEAREDD